MERRDSSLDLIHSDVVGLQLRVDQDSAVSDLVSVFFGIDGGDWVVEIGGGGWEGA
ncbi:hypothetical protein C1H46_003862 [Malus baccata]|uniref:Uncharacterized protein n=1 Tax=Malus baccata TaxID=106549 RepID=A0A540NHM6_MALBA|nr:hypothetical protein C1H46_003862 [Malus baccata]